MAMRGQSGDERTMIRVAFPRGIPDLLIPLDDDTKTVEDVKKLCFEKLRAPDVLCESISEVEVSTDILPAFGLVKADNEPMWLSPNHVFEQNVRGQVYKFRLRHRPPFSKIYSESEECKLLSEYFVIQALDDFLHGHLGKAMVATGVHRDTIIKLVLFALLLPPTMPLQNNVVIDRTFKIQNFDLLNYKNLFSKEIYHNIVATNSKVYRFIDHWCYFTGLRNSLKSYKDGQRTVLYYKREFIRLLLESCPSYCFEQFRALDCDVTFDHVQVKLVLYDELFKGKQRPGIYFDEDRQFALEEIDRVILKESEGGPTHGHWEVEINCCNGPKTLDRTLLFDDKATATTFVTMLQGYITLCFRPDINICQKLTSPSSEIRNNLMSFCPMTHGKAVELLKSANEHRAKNECKFLIYENANMLSEDRFQVATTDCSEPVCHIRYLNGKGFLLYSSSGSKEIPDHKELRIHLITLYGQQLRSDYALQNVDPESVFYVERTVPTRALTAVEMDDNCNRASSFVLEEDLGKAIGAIKNPDENLKRQVVPVGDDKRLKVELVATKTCYFQAMYAGMGLLAKLNRLHPSSMLGFYGTVFTQHTYNTYILEHSEYGDLSDFITTNKGTVRTYQKFRLAYEVAKIFCTLTQRESPSTLPLLHGNMRANNFWVFKRQGYYLKLGDPGLVSYYNALELHKPNNDQRTPWLAPERQKKLDEVTVASECYAVASTIAEIFHETDDLRSTLLKMGNDDAREQNKDARLHDFKIPPPEFPTSEDEAVTEPVKTVTNKLWAVLSQCWDSDPEKRPSPLELKNKIRGLEEEASYICEETGLEHLKAVVSALHRGDEHSVQERIKQLGSVKDCVAFLNDKHHGYLAERKDFQITNKELGEGHYGKVVKGRLMMNGSLIDVAIKINKTPEGKSITQKGEILREFTREFRLSARLDHPNIVKAWRWFLEKEHPFQFAMIMEIMNAGSLSEYASRHAKYVKKPSYLKTLLKLSLDIAKGMERCETMGVVHCDLAARNVLLHEDPNTGSLTAKVSDFGLAKVLLQEQDYYYEQGKAGKPMPIYWFAPEYLDFSRGLARSTGIKYTTEGDIWAYGTTVWELFNQGKRPQEAEAFKNLLKKPFGEGAGPHDPTMHKFNVLYDFYCEEKGRLPQQKFVPDDVYNVMKTCWQLTPEDRPRFAEIQKMICSVQEKYEKLPSVEKEFWDKVNDPKVHSSMVSSNA